MKPSKSQKNNMTAADEEKLSRLNHMEAVAERLLDVNGRENFSYLCIDPGDSNPSFFAKETGLVIFGQPVQILSPWNLAMIIIELERNPEAFKYIKDILLPFRNELPPKEVI